MSSGSVEIDSAKLNESAKNISARKLSPELKSKIISVLKHAVSSFSEISEDNIKQKIRNIGFIPIVFILAENATSIHYILPDYLQYVKVEIGDYTFIVGGKPKRFLNAFDRFFI